MPWITIGAVDDFATDAGTRISAGGRSLAVFRLGSDFFALENHCPHRGFPLHDGVLDGTRIRCRTHGSCFDLTSGAVVRSPARQGVATYRVEVIDGRVQVDLPD